LFPWWAAEVVDDLVLLLLNVPGPAVERVQVLASVI
jgi:hypothetical protein